MGVGRGCGVIYAVIMLEIRSVANEMKARS